MTAQAASVNVTVTGVVNAGPCTYRGFFIATTAVTTTVTLYDNASAASGTVLAQFALGSVGAFAQDDLTDGLRCVNGIFISVTGGPVAGHVRIG